jgi:hypothetical protein|tara:strand:+ start:481 stop:783 length:303 start_codon:yes stop_codon:yes gene_type:complete
MKKSDIKIIIREEISNFLKTEAPVEKTVQKGTVTDNARLTMILSSLGKRAKGSFQKRKVVSQVIMSLASALAITPTEVLRAYMDYKKDAKGDASKEVKAD